ncbi:MAG: Planctomycete cytochrome [Bryobacterales bacterium]|nr:Planctomycete cytochrome [Bryobacterales bacterium]
MILRRIQVVSAVAFLSVAPAFSQTPAQVELFEKYARPVFMEKCAGCHNEKLKSGGLDLTSTDALRQVAGSGIFGEAAHPEKSVLLKALAYEDRVRMPPQGKLPDATIEGIKEWLTAGAPIPGAATVSAEPGSGTGLRAVALRGKITEEDKKYWAFKPLVKPDVPAVKNTAWAGTAIDKFILAKLEGAGLQPAAPTTKTTLLRRATFDLTGLPPTEKELADFLADKSPKAFEKVVDRLLASPRYGERWGRHWLDVMRYADSTGSDEDHRYPHAWRYRDYVIDAFNADMPYDQFVREQLAGDILAADPNSNTGYRGVVATGFLALGKKALAQKDLPLKRYDVVDDQIEVTAKAFMGLTVNCARCHDHKFDPIATKDYYQLAGVFASTTSYAKLAEGEPIQTPLVPAEKFETFRKAWTDYLDVEKKIAKIIDFDKDAKKARDAEEANIARYMLGDQTLDPKKLAAWSAYLKSDAPELAKWRAATDANRKEIAQQYQEEFRRGAYQYDQDLSWWKGARNSYPNSGKIAGPRPAVSKVKDPFFYAVWLDPKGPAYRSKDEQIATLQPEKATELRALMAQSATLEKTLPTEEIPMASAVREGEAVKQHVFLRGDYHNEGDEVDHTPPMILRVNAPALPVKTNSGRLELANWIVDSRNPLPARVMANRIWQGHFGDGIVRTPDNFGRLGERPSNPELLDYLATSFMENGWSVKKMHRLIMLSNTYQMSAEYDAVKKEKDPENRLLSHFPRLRLSIEQIRDSYLAIGGDLDLKMGGTLDPGVGTDGETSANRISMNPEATTRRSVYLPLRRSNLPTLWMLFDFGDATTPDGKRSATTVSTQALFVLNSPLVNREAQALAERVMAASKSDQQRVESLYLKILNRKPDAQEIESGMAYVKDLQGKWKDIGPQKAWQSYSHALMASNEFIYIY